MTSPKHLEPLLDGTPLAIERITQAWPGLTTSDRVYLLSVLLADTSTERKTIRWSHHRKRLVDLALGDDNAYVRYLAAKDVSAPFKSKDAGYLEDKARFEKVQSDTAPLVRFASEEEGWKVLTRELDDPHSFWSRPQIERLALVNGVEESGETIAQLLRYATKNLLPTKAVSLDEMLDVLLQYLGGKTIAERVAASEDYAHRFYDGFAEYSAGESVKALWVVIPEIPKALSYVLIECLPEEAGFQSNIPLSVLESFDDHQLERLLWRNDVTLKDLRRKLYKESKNDSLRQAALTSLHLVLSDSDISELVYDPHGPVETGKKKLKELVMLAENCRGATLVQMQAICDLINDAPTDFHSGFGNWSAVDAGRMLQTERAKQLAPHVLEREVFAMRLFALAKDVAPIKVDDTQGALPDKLFQHKNLIVQQNPWQTYINLSKVVCLDRWKQTIGDLPSVTIQDIDLPEEVAENSDENSSHSSGRPSFNLLKDVQGRVKDVSEKDRAELSALSNALSQISNQMQDVEAMTGKRLEALHARAEKQTSTIKLVLWLVGAILFLALFKIW